MVGAEVHFVGKLEFSGGNSELVSLRGFLEDLVAARVLNFKREPAAGGGIVVGAVESQRANVNRLPRLIDRLLGGEQDGKLVLELHRLRVLAGTKGRLDQVAELTVAENIGGKAKLRVRRAAMIEASGE